MKVIILAAGIGSRLGYLTKSKPKCLVEFNNKSILDYQLEVLQKAKFDKLIIVGGHFAEQLKRPNVFLKKNILYKTTNMLYSLSIAKDEFDDDIIISYGDIVYSEDVLSKLIEEKEDISVIIDKNWKEYWSKRIQNPLDDVETLKIDKTGYITEIGLKPKTYNDIQGQYIGLIKISSEMISTILRKWDEILIKNQLNYSKNIFMTEFLQYCINSGLKLKALKTSYPWVEIDTPSDIEVAERLIKMGKFAGF